MRNKYFLSFMVVLMGIFILPSSILAQQPTAAPTTLLVRGKVIDRTDKLAIIGASVVELDKDKRTVTGVVTDLDGNFAIKIKDATHTISISYLGYKSQVVAINGRTTINISLE